jgi:fibronectin-binding autotransporter adhesin
MKHVRLLQALAGGLALVLVTLIALSVDTATAAPTATTRYVLGDSGSDSSDCTSANNPCKTIQYALTQASDGDTIRVAKGLMPVVYAETISIDKSVTLEGGWGAVGFPGGLLWQRSSPCDASWTTIDAGSAGRAISITGDITPTVDCFTITGGDATGLGGGLYDNDAGGGIYSRDAAPLITHNVITANLAGDGGYGGGIYLLNAPATAVISGNLIANNVADGPGAPVSGRGGGIMLRNSDALVTGNTIEDNLAGDGGGLGGGIAAINGSPTIAGNDILSNEAGQAIVCLGGGLYVRSSTPVTVERNLFQSNFALYPVSPGTIARGGGLHYDGNSNGHAIIHDNVFRWNIAAVSTAGVSEGGGMYLTDLGAQSSVSGNTIEDNKGNWHDSGYGGGIYVNQSEVVIEDNVLFDNSATWVGPHGEGGGLFVNSGAVLIQSNVITRNHGAGFGGFPSTSTGCGGGMAISDSQAIVQNNRIVDNNGTNGENEGVGGGIYALGGTLRIVGNTIAENRASGDEWGHGGGAFLQVTSLSMAGNSIVDNVAAGGLHGRGGGVRIVSCPAFTLTNNIVARNEASELGSGVAITDSSAGDLAHNTIADNSSGDGVGIHVDLNSAATLINNIVVSHTTGVLNADPGASAVNASYTLFEANGTDYSAGVSSSNEISGPAALLSNYHLSVGSSAVDQGITLAWVTDDIDGESRTYGAAPDVGADEVSCLARVGGVNYVTIQAAVDAVSPGQIVRVAAGTCYENVSIAKSVTLEGGWDTVFTTRAADPASASTIDGLGAGRVISITETSGSIAVTIDGFTITGGDATGLAGSGGYGYDIGGGIYSWYADTTVIDCIIIDNVASTTGIAWGGGIGAYGGSFTLQGSTLANNIASTTSNGYGGGACFRYGSAMLDGNTVEDNTAAPKSNGYGGGLWLANNSSTLQGNTVRDNVASIDHDGYGGGIEVYMGTANLTGNTLEVNRAVVSGTSGYGGGVSARNGATLTIDDSQIHDSNATFGGGLYIDSGDDAVISGTLIYSNTAGMGGGVYVTASANVSLTGNQVYDNSAGYGGGILLNGSADATLTGNYIHDNTTDGLGGGLWIWSCDNVRLTNNIIVENRLNSGGSGAGVHLFLNSSAHFEHTTLARNSGGDGTGLYIVSGSQAWMTNTIVAGHAIGVHVDSVCTLTLEATLWGDGAWANVTNKDGSGDIKDGEIIVISDPGFVDPDGVNSDDWDDYHIGHTSLAVDAGLDIGVATDIDGDTRPIGPAVDIGADEVWTGVFLPLILRE